VCLYVGLDLEVMAVSVVSVSVCRLRPRGDWQQSRRNLWRKVICQLSRTFACII